MTDTGIIQEICPKKEIYETLHGELDELSVKKVTIRPYNKNYAAVIILVQYKGSKNSYDEDNKEKI